MIKFSANETAQEEIRLDRLFAAVWRWKWVILVGTFLAAGITALVGFLQPTLYTATASIEVGRVWKDPLEDIYITTETINSDSFIQKLAAKIGARPGYLNRAIRAETVLAGPRRARYPILVRVTATTDRSDESVRLAQAVADEIIARHRELFDAALAPHLNRKRQLEERQKQFSNDASPAFRELALKVEEEIDEINANTSSPAVTEDTHLVESVGPGPTIRPSPWRAVVVVSLITALALTALAALVDYLKPAAHASGGARAL